MPRMGKEVKHVTSQVGVFKGTDKHLLITKGLNLKAVCSNPKCEGSKSQTWICLGYGTFDILK